MSNYIFSNKELLLMQEIFRRVNYFQLNLDSNLIISSFPSKIKPLIKIKMVEPSFEETPRVLNWYKLTKEGQEYFKDYKFKKKLNDNRNKILFESTTYIRQLIKFKNNYKL